MTAYRAGEITGALTVDLVVGGLLWVILVLGTMAVARVLGRRATFQQFASNGWILGIVAAVLMLQMVSELAGGR